MRLVVVLQIKAIATLVGCCLLCKLVFEAEGGGENGCLACEREHKGIIYDHVGITSVGLLTTLCKIKRTEEYSYNHLL